MLPTLRLGSSGFLSEPGRRLVRITVADGRLSVSFLSGAVDWMFRVKERRNPLRRAAFGEAPDKGTQNNCSPLHEGTTAISRP